MARGKTLKVVFKANHKSAFVKHQKFDRQQRKNWKERKAYITDNLVYDEKKKQFICPSGKPMKKIGPLRKQCHDQEGNRIIEVSHNLRRLKQQADKRLNTTRGIQKRKQLCYDVEPAFASIKHNHAFKRFMLRGIEKSGYRNRITGTGTQPQKKNSLKKASNPVHLFTNSLPQKLHSHQKLLRSYYPPQSITITRYTGL